MVQQKSVSIALFLILCCSIQRDTVYIFYSGSPRLSYATICLYGGICQRYTCLKKQRLRLSLYYPPIFIIMSPTNFIAPFPKHSSFLLASFYVIQSLKPTRDFTYCRLKRSHTVSNRGAVPFYVPVIIHYTVPGIKSVSGVSEILTYIAPLEPIRHPQYNLLPLYYSSLCTIIRDLLL